MSEADPSALPALFLDHILSGIEKLESCELDEQDRTTATQLAWRLYGVARKR